MCGGWGWSYVELVNDPGADKGVERTASGDILDEALGGGAAEDCPGRGGGGSGRTLRWWSDVELVSKISADESMD